jgi:hypothetical protein
MDLFLNPAYMIAGAALISAPIIIHLINRMRYKRIRWAAMEFLLKSQKRNRRRLIIEQLILLALRCALVALAGFLVARFIGEWTTPERDVDHLVVLDDTLSMKDRWREEGDDKTAFDVGKKKVLEVAKEALKANSPQYLRLVTLSSLDETKFNSRLNSQSYKELEGKLNDLQPSRLHVKPAAGVRWAHEQTIDPNHQRILHFVSDLRESDWTGPEVDTLNKELDDFTKAGGKVLLFDVAHLYRGERQPIALHHDNIGISDLRPETRFTAENMPVLFTATIKNFSAAKKNVFFNVKVDGQVRFEATQPIDINPGENRHTFLLSFNKRGYNMVSAALQDKDASGVPDDDTRVTVIKVEPQVPILMIDGGEDQPNGARKDSFYLQKLFVDAAKGYQIVFKTKEDLETIELTPDRFPCAYLLNVPSLSEKAAKRLEGYVEQGGRVAVFVGDRVQAAVYNKLLYANGNGIFPAPLQPRPDERVSPEVKFQRMFEGQYQIYLRDDTHPILKEVADPKIKESFKFLSIDQYWPTEPRFRWNADPSKVHELVTLPNRKELSAYTDAAGGGAPGELLKQIQALLGEEKFDSFRASLKRHADNIRKSLGGNELYALAGALDGFLTDRGDPRDRNNKDRPDLKEFWEMPETARLREDVVRLRDTVTYGDPLVLTKSFGKGETVVFLTTAGLAWNDWGGRSMASPTYPIVMLSLQKYLTSAGDESSRTLGTPLEVVLDADSYQDRAKVSFQAAPGEEKEGAAPAAGGAAAADAAARELETLTAKDEGKQLRFSFPKTREPGVYYVSVKGKQKPNETKEPQPYDEAFVYNVDTENEGNLKRAARDMLERGGGSAAGAHGQVALITPDMRLTEILAPKRKDMSEAPWLYLVILIILIVEQALAVHLSFHLKGNEAQLPPGIAGEARTPVPVASDAA